MSASDNPLKGPQIVFALYKPHDGKDADMRRILVEHVPTLRRLELITDRPTILVQTRNGSYIEIFEWATEESARIAHTHPEVAKVWESMGKVGDLPLFETIDELKGRFPHFAPVTL
jgi:hypothetical protein